MPARAVSGSPFSGLGAVPVMAVPGDGDGEPACHHACSGSRFEGPKLPAAGGIAARVPKSRPEHGQRQEEGELHHVLDDEKKMQWSTQRRQRERDAKVEHLPSQT